MVRLARRRGGSRSGWIRIVTAVYAYLRIRDRRKIGWNTVVEGVRRRATGNVMRLVVAGGGSLSHVAMCSFRGSIVLRCPGNNIWKV